MVAVSERMSIVNTAMTLKFNVLDNVVRKDLGSSDVASALKNNNALDKATQPVEITVNGRTMTLLEVGDYLKQMRADVKEKHVHNPIMFDKLFTVMAKAYSSHQIERMMQQLEDLMTCIGHLSVQLEKMQSVARNLSTDGTPGAVTQDVGEHLRQVLFQASREIIAMGSIAAEIKLYFKNLQVLANHALGFGVEVVRKASTEMRKQGKDVPQGWEDVLADLMRQQKAITQGYYRRK
jgi:hypothetical protein